MGGPRGHIARSSAALDAAQGRKSSRHPAQGQHNPYETPRPCLCCASQIIKRPEDALLAFLLGTAIGVMFTLSVAEMWIHNAMEHGWLEVTGAVLVGALLYQVVQPFLPDFDYEEKLLADKVAGEGSGDKVQAGGA